MVHFVAQVRPAATPAPRAHPAVLGIVRAGVRQVDHDDARTAGCRPSGTRHRSRPRAGTTSASWPQPPRPGRPARAPRRPRPQPYVDDDRRRQAPGHVRVRDTDQVPRPAARPHRCRRPRNGAPPGTAAAARMSVRADEPGAAHLDLRDTEQRRAEADIAERRPATTSTAAITISGRARASRRARARALNRRTDGGIAVGGGPYQPPASGARIDHRRRLRRSVPTAFRRRAAARTAGPARRTIHRCRWVRRRRGRSRPGHGRRRRRGRRRRPARRARRRSWSPISEIGGAPMVTTTSPRPRPAQHLARHVVPGSARRPCAGRRGRRRRSARRRPRPARDASPGPNTSRITAWSAMASAVAISAWKSRVRYIRYGWKTTISCPSPATSRSVSRAAVIEVGW